jgi:hypothetical protein
MALSLAAVAMSTSVAVAQTPMKVVRDYRILATSTHPEVTVRVLFLSLLTPKPTVGVILFPGGRGNVLFDGSGEPYPASILASNFLVRNRVLFAQKGVTVAVIDWPSGGLGNADRLTQGHADILSQLILKIRTEKTYEVSRVWLVGTSAGTLSASNVASKYPRQQVFLDPDAPGDPNVGRANGIVLTSALTAKYTSSGTTCDATVDNQTPTIGAINVPAYVVWNATDSCGCSTALNAPYVVPKLTKSPKRLGKEFVGPNAPGHPDQCGAQTPHGFYNIDDQVVTDIVNFVRAN